MPEITTFPDDVEATVQKLMKLPPDQRVAIGERLIESVPANVSPKTLAEWRSRLKDIEDGVEEGIPADEVLVEIRQALHEARQVSHERQGDAYWRERLDDIEVGSHTDG